MSKPTPSHQNPISLILRFLILSASIAAIWPPTSTLAQEYEILLTRPVKVGHKSKVSASGHETQNRNVSVGGQSVQAEKKNKSASLEATREVIAVDKRGQVTKARFTVDTAKSNEGEKDSPLFAKGTVIIATHDGKDVTYSVDGKPILSPKGDFLDMVINLDSGEDTPEMNEDTIFGTKKKQQVGASWPIDEKAFLDFLKKKANAPFEMTVKSGTVTLAKVAELNGVKCLFLTAKVSFDLDSIPGLPPSAKFKTKDLNFHYHITVPVNGSLPRAGEEFSMAMDMDMAMNAQGQQMEMKMAMEKRSKATYQSLQ